MSSCFFVGLLASNNLPTDTFVHPYTVKKKLLNYISFERRCLVVWLLELGIETRVDIEIPLRKIPRNGLGVFFVKK
jgi:hypothetical protein